MNGVPGPRLQGSVMGKAEDATVMLRDRSIGDGHL